MSEIRSYLLLIVKQISSNKQTYSV